MNRTQIRLIAFGLVSASVSIGCGDDASDGPGTLSLTAYGEEFVEEGIDAALLEDDYTLRFSSFEVRLVDVSIDDIDVTVPTSVELAQPSSGLGVALASVELSAGANVPLAFTLESMHVVGTATRGNDTWSFDWDIPVNTTFSNCEEQPSIVAGGTSEFQLTFHADHLLYDSLAVEEPNLTFDAYTAADTDGDFVITQQELAEASVGLLDPGNETVSNMSEWLQLAAQSVGHVNGEGHCTASTRR